jgi:hypothetical protein
MRRPKEKIRNLGFTAADWERLARCPSCGGLSLELRNTHTACYVVCCLDCEAEGYSVEMGGKPFGRSKASVKLTYNDHWRAKRSALSVWNRRLGIGRR